jgi:broad specificity phosphatase PhoE
MSRLYLVRHGQAGTRKAYDSLSELGRRQARLLGEYFVSEKIHFTGAYCGALVRQEETAAEV